MGSVLAIAIRKVIRAIEKPYALGKVGLAVVEASSWVKNIQTVQRRL